MSDEKEQEQERRTLEVVYHAMTQLCMGITLGLGEVAQVKRENPTEGRRRMTETIEGSRGLLESCLNTLEMTDRDRLSADEQIERLNMLTRDTPLRLHWTPEDIERDYGVPADQVMRDIMSGHVPKAKIDGGVFLIHWYDVKHLYARRDK